jgi:predicted AAA+ superfamily ATPase
MNRFDKIHACPRAIMALRYFYEEIPDLHVVADGSLLEFAFGDISIPVGRVQYLYPLTFYEYLLAMYRGKLAEQFVAQELLAWHNSDLFYWSHEARSSTAEIDYLTVFEGNIYPIEVRSGAGGSLRSLHLMLEKYPNCPRCENKVVIFQ